MHFASLLPRMDLARSRMHDISLPFPIELRERAEGDVSLAISLDIAERYPLPCLLYYLTSHYKTKCHQWILSLTWSNGSNECTYLFQINNSRVTTERRRRSAKSTGNWTSRGGECGARWSTRADKMAQVKMDNFACLNYLFCGCFIFWPSVKLRHLWLSNFSASETGTFPVQ